MQTWLLIHALERIAAAPGINGNSLRQAKFATQTAAITESEKDGEGRGSSCAFPTVRAEDAGVQF